MLAEGNFAAPPRCMYAREVSHDRDSDWLSFALAFVAAALPAALAASHVSTIGDAAHDLESVRVLGLGFTGGFRALDVVLAAPFALVPLGTRAMRAALGSVAGLGLVSLSMLSTARRRTRSSLQSAPRLAAFTAVVASLLATLAPAMQTEAVAIGGATVGVLLALLPRALHGRSDPTRVALALGLAFGYEPLVGLCALVSLLPLRSFVEPLRASPLRAALAFAAGVLPLFASIALRGATDARPFALAWGEGWAARSSPLSMLVSELGVVVLGLALGGLALLVSRPDGRRDALSSALVLALACTSVSLGCAVGPARWSPLALVAICEVALLAVTGMTALLSFVRETRVPFAKASAWLVGVVLLAIVARQADDASLRLAKRTGEPERAFARYAWDTLPLGALALIADRDVALRVEAARAEGDVRSDVAFVRLGSSSAMSDITREPKLAPLLRDQALYGAPEEWSLSALAAARPVVLTFDARWPRALARHLVAVGPFDRFYSEPRGLSDRRDGLAMAEPARLALTFTLERSPDPELARVTAMLLRARLLGAAASGDRDVIGQALDGLRPFAPGDPTAFEIVRRMTLTRGPIDLTDLAR